MQNQLEKKKQEKNQVKYHKVRANCRGKILECKPSKRKYGLFEKNLLPDPFLYGTIINTCFQI